MQRLKFLVISMGALIVIGLGLLVYGVYHQAVDPDSTQQAEPLKTRHKSWKAPEPFGDIDVTLPEGCHIEKMLPDRGRLFLQVGPGGVACERVVVVDVRKGAVLGTLNIKNIKTGP